MGRALMMKSPLVFWPVVIVSALVALWLIPATDGMRSPGRGIAIGIPSGIAGALLFTRWGQARSVRQAKQRVAAGSAVWAGVAKAVVGDMSIASQFESQTGGWVWFDATDFTFEGKYVRRRWAGLGWISERVKSSVPVASLVGARLSSRSDFMGRRIDRLEIWSSSWAGAFDVLEPAGELPESIRGLLGARQN